MILALMASGLSGQRWRFVGYLPVADEDRRAELRALEAEALGSGETQIVMETPYRNQRLWQEILAACRPETMLCIASNLSTPEELIRTRTVAEWRKVAPNLPKVPALFLLGR
jgi:16S rRNA (cytidine1402-2'-O)-methyltransferase